MEEAGLLPRSQYWVASRDAPLNAAAVGGRTLLDDSATAELYRSLLEDRPEQLEDATDAEGRLAEPQEEILRRRAEVWARPVQVGQNWHSAVRELQNAVDTQASDEAVARQLLQDVRARHDFRKYEQLQGALLGLAARYSTSRRLQVGLGRRTPTTGCRTPLSRTRGGG